VTAGRVFKGLDRSLTQFHEWALGDLKSPTTKGMIAEYVVRSALGHDAEPVLEWDFVDIRTSSGTIEVKSTSSLSSGPDQKVISPKFGIERKKMTWSAVSNRWVEPDPTRRHADIYVFCLHAETNPVSANPLDMSQWRFWAISSRDLDQQLGLVSKSVSVTRLGAWRQMVVFQELADAVATAFANQHCGSTGRAAPVPPRLI
jgi:hypothetical protein